MAVIQLGVNVRGPDSWRDCQRLVRRADGLSCDVFAALDHLGGPAPFSTYGGGRDQPAVIATLSLRG